MPPTRFHLFSLVIIHTNLSNIAHDFITALKSSQYTPLTLQILVVFSATYNKHYDYSSINKWVHPITKPEITEEAYLYLSLIIQRVPLLCD